MSWALAEVGLERWGLLARAGGPLVIGLWFIAPALLAGLKHLPVRVGLAALIIFVAAFCVRRPIAGSLALQRRPSARNCRH